MESKRRDKGEGSVYQRKDGKWVAKFKPQNHSNTKYFYGKNEKEVKRKLKEFQYELIKNDYVEVKKKTVREYMNYWFYEIKIHELKPKSFDRSESTLINHIYPYIGDLQIAGLTANDIQNMINELVKKDLSYSSIHRAYVTINNCFKLGVIKGEVIKNPCIGVMLPLNRKKMVTSIKYFTDDEVKRICEESIRTYSNGAKVYRLGNVIVLLLYTGMRIGECLGLKWSDVDIDKKQIIIHGNVVVVKNREDGAETKFQVKYQDSPKTISGNRVIYLNQKAIDAILELKKLNGNFEYVAGTANNSLVIPKNIDRMFRNILKKCDIEPCGVHICRHTFASILFKKGVDVKTVSELLGHKDVSVTYNVYIHLIQEQKQQAISLLDDI